MLLSFLYEKNKSWSYRQGRHTHVGEVGAGSKFYIYFYSMLTNLMCEWIKQVFGPHACILCKLCQCFYRFSMKRINHDHTGKVDIHIDIIWKKCKTILAGIKKQILELQKKIIVLLLLSYFAEWKKYIRQIIYIYILTE